MNILDEIFYGNISGAECKTSNEYKKACNKELKVYEKIKSTFKEEDMKLVEELLNLYQESTAILEKDLYTQGFKIGLLLGIECAKFEV